MDLTSYKHDLGGGSVLTAYSIDPAIDKKALEECVEGSLLSRKSKNPADLNALSKTMPLVGVYRNFSAMNLRFSFDKYNVPEPLHKHRDAVQLRFSDSIMVFRNGDISVPAGIIKGEYRDFVATDLKRVPSDLVPDTYPKGKTIAELLPRWGLSDKAVAKWLATAHFMTPSNGAEFSFVYRGKNLHIAPDCIALSGSTPKFPDQFNHKSFNVDTYFKDHLIGEMQEEYCLNPDEFEIGKLPFINDTAQIPFVAVQIKTSASTEELARKAHNQKQPMKEHSIIFGVDKGGLRKLIEQVDIFPSTARVIDVVSE